MTMARAKWRAVSGRTAFSMSPSRKWTCQSSGRRMVRVSVMGFRISATAFPTPAARRAAFLGMCGARRGNPRPAPAPHCGAAAGRLISARERGPDARRRTCRHATRPRPCRGDAGRHAGRHADRAAAPVGVRQGVPAERAWADAGGRVPQHGRGPDGRRPLRLFRPSGPGACATLTTQTAERAYRSAGGAGGDDGRSRGRGRGHASLAAAGDDPVRRRGAGPADRP